MTMTSGVFPNSLTSDIALILDTISEGVYACDATGRIVLVNRAAATAIGYEPSELIGRIPHEVMHHSRPDGSHYPIDDCPLATAGARGQAYRADEDVFWRRDGSSFQVEYESQPLSSLGEAGGFLVTFRDITPRKRNEQRLRELLQDQFALARAEFQRAQLSAALAQTPAIICITRGARHIVETVNAQFTKLIANTDATGKSLLDVFPAVDEQVGSLMDLAFQSGEPQRATELPVAVQSAAGAETRFFDYTYQPLRDESNFVYGVMAHGVDVTEAVQARRALEARTQELEGVAARLRMAAEAGRLGTWEWQLPSRRVIWSPEIERIHGLELGTFPGTFEAYQSDLHPEDRERVLAQVEETIANHTPYLMEYRIVRPDGDVRWIEARGQMFLGTDGAAERVVGICLDITERKRNEEVLAARADDLSRLAEALERSNRELDAFAYAASHDLRAPLRGIANLAQWIEEDLTASSELRSETGEMLELMRSRMHRMEALIDGILQYSRAGRIAQNIERVDIRRLVQEVLDLLAVPDRVTIEVGEMPTIDAAPLPLQQIFMNLIGNALKYADKPHTVITISSADLGRFHRFSVSDNGPGIPAEYHERVWGIFQTLVARDKVEGTGIGLSLVKKLVESQGGRVWLESTTGEGTTFFFTWPKRDPRPAGV